MQHCVHQIHKHIKMQHWHEHACKCAREPNHCYGNEFFKAWQPCRLTCDALWGTFRHKSAVEETVFSFVSLNVPEEAAAAFQIGSTWAKPSYRLKPSPALLLPPPTPRWLSPANIRAFVFCFIFPSQHSTSHDAHALTFKLRVPLNDTINMCILWVACFLFLNILIYTHSVFTSQHSSWPKSLLAHFFPHYT